MTGAERHVLIALSRGLEQAHMAYIKSLTAAKIQVVRCTDIDDFIVRASAEPELLVIGSMTGLPNVTGNNLLEKLEAVEPLPSAPVLFLHDARAPRRDLPKTRLRVFTRWSQARESLGLGQARRPSKDPEPRLAVEPVRIKSTDPTLELGGAAVRAGGTSPSGTKEWGMPPGFAKRKPLGPTPTKPKRRDSAMTGLSEVDAGWATEPEPEDTEDPLLRELTDELLLSMDSSKPDRPVVKKKPRMGVIALSGDLMGRDEAHDGSATSTDEVELPPPPGDSGVQAVALGRPKVFELGADLIAEEPTPDDVVPTAGLIPPPPPSPPPPSPPPPAESLRELAAVPPASGKSSEVVVDSRRAPPISSRPSVVPGQKKSKLPLLIIAGVVVFLFVVGVVVVVVSGVFDGEEERPEPRPDSVVVAQPDTNLAQPEADAGGPAPGVDGGGGLEPSDGAVVASKNADVGDEASVGRSEGTKGTEYVLPFRFERNVTRPYYVNDRELREILQMIRSNPLADFELVGHASIDEPERRAERIGLLRAKAARDIICLKGPSRKRFVAVSAGADEPIQDSSSGRPAKAASRRVTLRVLGEGAGDGD